MSKLLAAAAMITLSAAGAAAQDARLTIAREDLVWGPAPASLPKGAQAVVLAGNPTASGPFTLRLKLPAGYRIPPHEHSSTERVTVLEGTYSISTGDVSDPAATRTLSAGGFSVMPADTRHFAYTKDGATIQVHGWGPLEMAYVDPADDPRKASAPAK